MNSPHEHHDVHQQRLLWFFSFCNQRSSSSSSSSGGSSTRRSGSRRKSASNRNKFATQYQQQLQQQQRQSSNVFGRDLTEHTQTFGGDDAIPNIVKSSTKFIEKHGIIFGIYRLSGMRVNIHKLRQEFDRNPKISMIDSEAISNDAHAVACVLKQYFRELPTPLLTFHMYEKFIKLFKHSNSSTTNNFNNNNNNSNINDNNDNSNNAEIIHDQGQNDKERDNTTNKCGIAANVKQNSAITVTTNASPSTSPTIPPGVVVKSKSSSTQQSTAGKSKSQFTTSASDSQLISLSSVVTTTIPDIKYQVKLDDLRRLLLQLPRAHYQTLKFLMRHLACIAANGQKTGMDSKNVAIVWAPNLLKPRELELSAGLETLQIIGLQAVITEQLIKHHEFLFQDDDPKAITREPGTRVVENIQSNETNMAKIDNQICEGADSFHQQQQPAQIIEPVHKDNEQITTFNEVNARQDKDRDENEENNF